MLLIAAMGFAGCGTETPQPAPAGSPSAPAPGEAPVTAESAPAIPVWKVGAKPLPRRPDGLGQILPTPPELVDRALPTEDFLPPPAADHYASTVAPVPPDILDRSTWQAACPVASTALRYLTISFWGFDGGPHTGEMIVNASAAEGVTQVFGRLFAQRFPLEEMRVTRPDELMAVPTGDGNNTSAFVCRPARGMTSWSAHAYGLAVDVNPFCNPYTKGDLVLPELASAYLDRKNLRPGMLLPGDPVVRAFASIGWSWGGAWSDPKDRMHFSATGN